MLTTYCRIVNFSISSFDKSVIFMMISICIPAASIFFAISILRCSLPSSRPSSFAVSSEFLMSRYALRLSSYSRNSVGVRRATEAAAKSLENIFSRRAAGRLSRRDRFLSTYIHLSDNEVSSSSVLSNRPTSTYLNISLVSGMPSVIIYSTPSLTDTSLPLNQSCRLAQERGAVGRSGVLVGNRRRIRTIRFHKFFSTLCRWLQTCVMVAIV